MPALKLLDLTPDLLNDIAYHLPPRHRLNLACTNRHLFNTVWGRHAEAELVARFPLERRLIFPLTVYLDSAHNATSSITPLRTVPSRSRLQHVSVAINPTGTIVALLPYDNILRLICTRRSTIFHRRPLPVFSNDVWDVARGVRRPQARPSRVAYADDAGLDVEASLDFSADGRTLLASSRDALRLFQLEPNTNGEHPTLKQTAEIALRDALIRIAPTATATGGAASLSKDGCSIAWTIFVHSPAVIHVAVWHAEAPHVGRAGWKCHGAFQAERIWSRRWSSLAWARPFFTPGGDVVTVVNCAHKVTRVTRIEGEYVRSKLSRFVIVVYNEEENAVVARRTEWLDVAPDVYPCEFANAVRRALAGRKVHADGGLFGEERILEGRERAVLRRPGLYVNSVHSCPAEATYKALSFGKARHPWFVCKQPMFSFHFGPNGERVVVATSPHENGVHGLRGKWEDGHVGNVEEEEKRVGREVHSFRMMPWRTAFAMVTAFSTSGKWLVGAALLEDDRCCVCVRNMTEREYFGDRNNAEGV